MAQYQFSIGFQQKLGSGFRLVFVRFSCSFRTVLAGGLPQDSGAPSVFFCRASSRTLIRSYACGTGNLGLLSSSPRWLGGIRAGHGDPWVHGISGRSMATWRFHGMSSCPRGPVVLPSTPTEKNVVGIRSGDSDSASAIDIPSPSPIQRVTPLKCSHLLILPCP